MTLAALEETPADGFDFEAAWRAVEPDDLVTLIYTSGTTGPPKGVQTTHRHVSSSPRDHRRGRRPRRRPDHLVPAQRPHRRPGDHAVLRGAARRAGHLRRRREDDRRRARGHPPDDLVRGAAGLGEAQGGAGGQGPGSRPGHRPEPLRAQLRAAIGLDQCRWAWSGAAAIAPETLDFFPGLGIPLVELWGMSEVTGAGILNPPDRPRVGTVGLPLPGLETRLLDDGELLVRAPYLTSGYRNDPERTAEAIDADGWLHTGDVARIDADGYVTIVDRKKEIIISAGGKNMSPANIESTLKVELPARRRDHRHRRRPPLQRGAGRARPGRRGGVRLAARAARPSPRSWPRTPGCARRSGAASRRATPGCRGSSRSRSSRSCRPSGSRAATS